MLPRPIARKCRVLLWSVSSHICHCGTVGQLARLMALTLSGWKPIHHAGKKNRWGGKGKGKREGGLGENNGDAVLYGFKGLFITVVPLSGFLSLYPRRESNPCQIHSWGMDVEKWIFMKLHRQTAGNRHSATAYTNSGWGRGSIFPYTGNRSSYHVIMHEHEWTLSHITHPGMK